MRIRIGSRESKLAVIQAETIMDLICRGHPEIELELVTMKTTGDMILDRSLDTVGGKGLFVKELDQALRDGRIDIAVHSLKDMPMDTPEDLPLLAFSKREDPRDVLVLPIGAGGTAGNGVAGAETVVTGEIAAAIISGAANKPIGSSSARRNLQLRRLYDGVPVEGVRGNVLTRLAKLDRGDYRALVLASAGLKRLGLENRISRVFEPSEMIPAAGQGIMAVQGRAGENYGYLDCVNDKNAQMEAVTERAFVRALDGGCSAPIAAFAETEGGIIKLMGLYYIEDKDEYITGTTSGRREAGEALGEELARRLKAEA
ncbi:MAG TPA: hydroxymethylbilane synthase [Anaerovoracaceae bacterium]|nr:hydroxymethylbilane synthase [Anaerovoracaceae bacterium]